MTEPASDGSNIARASTSVVTISDQPTETLSGKRVVTALIFDSLSVVNGVIVRLSQANAMIEIGCHANVRIISIAFDFATSSREIFVPPDTISTVSMLLETSTRMIILEPCAIEKALPVMMSQLEIAESQITPVNISSLLSIKRSCITL